MNGSGDFSQDDMELLAQAQREQMAVDAANPPLEEDPPAPPPPAPAPPAPAPAPVAATPPPPAPAPADKGMGSLNAALRASRHAERSARERADKAEKEAEELRKLIPAPKAVEVPALSDKVRTDLESYAPEAVAVIEAHDKALKDANAEIERLRKLAPAAAPPAAPEFTPEQLKDDVQEVVDTVPDMLEWQTNPARQAAWEAVKAADEFLYKSGAFVGKTLAERFQAAVAQVKAANPALVASAPAVDPAKKAQELIDALPIDKKPPRSGDLRSGEGVHTEIPDFHLMAKQGMSDEEIMARLN